MPTITSLSGQFFNNLGPLTTTFTAPASCATLTNNIVLSTNKDRGFPYGLDCNTETSTLGDCLPSGSAIDAKWASFGGSPVRKAQINYFSPGLGCPSAWSTAGVAARDGAGALSSAGVFTSTSALVYNGGFVDFPRPNLLMSALAPGETAVLCCPSGFTPEQDACVSTFATSSLHPTSGCAYIIPNSDFTFIPTTVTAPDTTVSANIFTLTATLPATEPVTTILAPSELSDWAAVSFLPMVTLVHQASDLPATTSPASTGTANSTSATAAGSASPSGTSSTSVAARSLTSSSQASGLARVCVLVWAAAAFMGGMVVLPL